MFPDGWRGLLFVIAYSLSQRAFWTKVVLPTLLIGGGIFLASMHFGGGDDCAGKMDQFRQNKAEMVTQKASSEAKPEAPLLFIKQSASRPLIP